MRLPNSEHESHPWVIAQIAPDFRLEDAWALPASGTLEEFDSFLALSASIDPTDAGSWTSRLLFTIRLRVGGWLGWDDVAKERPIPGCVETTLRERLPDELRGTAEEPRLGDELKVAGGFVPLYRTEQEWAAEISNATVHAILHLAWVEQSSGRYRGQMGVYVKPRGLLGRAYMMMIEPFRRVIVYPALMRQIRRAWEARAR